MSEVQVLWITDRIKRDGGVQRLLRAWIEGFSTNTVSVDILTFKEGEDEDFRQEFIDMGCLLYRIDPFNPLRIPRFISQIRNFLKEHPYDVIHGHSSMKNGFIMLAAKQAKVPVRIAHSHIASFQKTPFSGMISKLTQHMVLRYANRYIACSELAGQFLFGKNAVKRGKIDIINNGVDVSRFTFSDGLRRKTRADLELEDHLVIGHVGRLMKQKNHLFLINVFREILDREPGAILVLTGDTQQEGADEVIAHIDKLGLSEKVRILGRRNDVREVLCAFDVFVFPSLFEGAPVSVVEAQACDLPCVISDTVTKEVKILPTARYLSLDDNLEKWADEAISLARLKYNNRTDTKREIAAAGYDQVACAHDLEKLYVKYYQQSKTNI